MRGSAFLALVLAITAPLSVARAMEDAPGTADHPMVPRFEGAAIIGHEAVSFDAFDLPLGPAVRGPGDAWVPETVRPVEGRRTRLIYVAPPDASPLEIVRNYQQALGAEGFETLWQCGGSACGPGGGSFLVSYVLYPLDRKLSTLGRLTEHAFSLPRDPRYAALARETAEGTVVVSVFAAVEGFDHHPETREHPLVLVDVVESAPMDDRMVFVDAEAMAGDLDEEGRVALYGIHFAFDRDEVQPESDPTLAEIAALLAGDPALTLYVVGHTDMTGGHAYNMDLSRRRAAAVVAALTGRFGVAPDRLVPAGVGPLAPVARNDTEAGRALNRRVELVRR
ncbi:OmpA family protein [Roseospira goensis]|uniref:Outer membrane protein OmpA-like peptidoglycan-associated protein n=1 Tax=Roseospira goensis TaxID=391922 RepID=A0A7W6RYU9_9PROT|nr:OmpA family protein [Roseospira goensis]MBB4285072.1 outer membrane protein OmpA-like peptidoglycan-associated protein [Roseospira goensis]